MCVMTMQSDREHKLKVRKIGDEVEWVSQSDGFSLVFPKAIAMEDS